MRYRVKEYTAWRSRTQIRLSFEVPQDVYDSLTTSSTYELDAASTKYVIESCRLIADETQGGYVLCSTGQKGTIASVQKVSDRIVLIIPFEDLVTAADGDTDDLTAIENISTDSGGEYFTDQFTIEMDWGDEPSGLSGGDDAHNLAEFFGVTEVQGYEFMTDTEVTDTLEDIMGNLDTDLGETVEYPEGSGTYMTLAQAITAEAMEIINTQNS